MLVVRLFGTRACLVLFSIADRRTNTWEVTAVYTQQSNLLLHVKHHVVLTAFDVRLLSSRVRFTKSSDIGDMVRCQHS